MNVSEIAKLPELPKIEIAGEDRFVIVFRGIDGPTGIALHERGVTGEHIPAGRTVRMGGLDPFIGGDQIIRGPCFKMQKYTRGVPTWMAVRDYVQVAPADMTLIEFVDAWMSEMR